LDRGGALGDRGAAAVSADSVAEGLTRQPPFCKGAADVDFLQRRVADQVEALGAGGGMSDDPVTDLMTAVTGVANVMLKLRRQLRRIAVLEQSDAGAIEGLVDLAHARFANKMAQ